MLWKMVPRLIGSSPSHGEGPLTAVLVAMQEGFTTLSGKYG